METKICRICGKEKPITEFRKVYRKEQAKYYYRTECQECERLLNRQYELKRPDRTEYKKAYLKEWYKKNKEHVKQYREENKETITAKRKEYYEKTKDRQKKRSREYYEQHKDRYKEHNKKYKQQNKDKIHEYNVKYNIENNEAILKRKRRYHKENKDKEKAYNYKYRHVNIKKRLKEDKVFKLKMQLRRLIYRSFTRKGYNKQSHTQEIIGCDYETFIKHLLETYKKNYNEEWDGKEKVHIDHIKPLAEAKTEQDVIRLCHYTNLQLLKAQDNIIKNSKTEWTIEDKKGV